MYADQLQDEVSAHLFNHGFQPTDLRIFHSQPGFPKEDFEQLKNSETVEEEKMKATKNLKDFVYYEMQKLYVKWVFRLVVAIVARSRTISSN